MPRLFAFRSCLPGLVLSLLFAGGCGEDEGGRCQISSDCASGLTCFGGETGNGVCRANTPAGTNDAAAPTDVAPDLMSSAGPEAQDLAALGQEAQADLGVVVEDAPADQAAYPGPEAAPATVDASVDVASEDAAPSPAPLDGGVIDTGAVDAGSAG